MRKTLIILAALLMFMIVSTGSVFADVYVHGYTRKDGTYVKPHYRSDPDGDPTNNWSYPGNTNPYTGMVAPSNSSTGIPWMGIILAGVVIWVVYVYVKERKHS